MRYRIGYGTLISGVGKNNFSNDNNPTKVGKVYGVVTTENTPTKKQFQRAGGFSAIGSVFYLDYKGSENIDGNNSDSFFDSCNIAKPFHSSNQNYPLIGELILLQTLPSAGSQLSPNSNQAYYVGTINLFNNPQQNAPSGNTLGKTFNESSDIRPLLSFEGDRIYQGRKGNGIRFGSTVSSKSDISEWSRNGRPDGDPITILVNGYVTTDTGSLTPNIEEINKEISSIYLTSTQKLPLIPGASIINPVLSTLPPDNYINSQIILNSDRVTLNSKKDEVLLYAKTNIGLNTDNNIVLNAGQNVHINIESSNPDSKILLGTKTNNTAPDEPVLLGNQTVILLEQLITTLNMLGSYMASATVPTSDGSIAIPAVNDAGIQLLNSTSNLCDQLLKITSDKVYTV
jgi:hypothetical protein